MTDWKLFTGSSEPHAIERMPAPPPWRNFAEWERDQRKLGIEQRGKVYQATQPEIDIVNAALYLRRPLLITGKPGTGKSSLAYAVARELTLGPVLHWPINTRSTLQEGLYRYDAIARLQDTSLNRDTSAPSAAPPDIGKYIQLGPLGTAMLPANLPRVLLIDEIDKSDIDLPNDLLNIFEEGMYEIPELARHSKEQVEVRTYGGDVTDDRDAIVTITRGRVRCREFPFVVLTSNEEREFPPAFLRRCLRLKMEPPTGDQLLKIVKAHFGEYPITAIEQTVQEHIQDFLKRRDAGNADLATDQLLNSIYFVLKDIDIGSIRQALLRELNSDSLS